jgi:hypothetical protein
VAEQIWHLTHRCYQRELLLKLAQERETWLGWLLEAPQKQLGIKAKGREAGPVEGDCQLRETETVYQGILGSEKGGFSREKHVVLEPIVPFHNVLARSDPIILEWA